jgi:hypothetical protein
MQVFAAVGRLEDSSAAVAPAVIASKTSVPRVTIWPLMSCQPTFLDKEAVYSFSKPGGV